MLHLFRDTVDADALRGLGDPQIAGQDTVPQLTALTREAATGLLDRAADIGLLTSLGSGYYQIHPALPWYFTTQFAAAIGPPGTPDAARAARAYTHTLAWLGYYYHEQHQNSHSDPMAALALEEGNLRQALTLALDTGYWGDVTDCMHGLQVLYMETGRDGEWARLFAQVTPAFIDPATDGPLPGREDQWTFITEYRVRLAMAARDWPIATRLQNLQIAWHRKRAADALAAPVSQLTPAQRVQIRNLAVCLEFLGHILSYQKTPAACRTTRKPSPSSSASRTQSPKAGSPPAWATPTRTCPACVTWTRHSTGSSAPSTSNPSTTWFGKAENLGSLGNVAWERFLEARATDQPEAVLLGHLNAALHGYQQALDLCPADDAEDLSITYHQIGNVYSATGDTRRALHHYQQSLRFEEARGDIYGAGTTRFNIAKLLRGDGRPGDALLYARAALHDYERTGPGATRDAAEVRDFITHLEHGTG